MITTSTSSVGEVSRTFSFTFSIDTPSDLVTADIDGTEFYQLNYPQINTNYPISVSDNLLASIGGGSHVITVRSGEDTAEVTFSKIPSIPVVSVPSNVGDKKSSFVIPFTIKNAKSEHPALVAYMDTVTTIIFQTDDASNINSITVDVTDLEAGAHSVIIAVTNDAGTTTKNTAFNLVADDKSYTGLKLGYNDDTWDGTVLENRIYEETDVTYAGKTYKSYEDKTPYDTEGEVVTGGLLAAMSRGVQNAGASNLTRNTDGSYTEISANGVSNLVKTDNGYAEVFTDKEGNILTKNVYINADGSVAESTTFERAE